MSLPLHSHRAQNRFKPGEPLPTLIHSERLPCTHRGFKPLFGSRSYPQERTSRAEGKMGLNSPFLPLMGFRGISWLQCGRASKE